MTDQQIFLSADERAALEGDDEPTNGVAATDAAAAPADDGDAGQDEYQPLLQVREVPRADEALAALDDKEAELNTKFDEGEITSGELASGLREIGKHRSEIEWAQRKNDLAETMQRDHEDARWNAAVKDFLKGPGAAIAKNESMALAFDTHVRKVTADPANANLSFHKQLEKAHKLFTDDIARSGYSLDRGFDNDMASGGSSADFAALDRLADSNPRKFEIEFAKLSPSDQASYLES